MNLNIISKDMTKHYCGNVVYDSDERMLLTDEGYVNRGDGVFDSITNWLDDILYRQQTK